MGETCYLPVTRLAFSRRLVSGRGNTFRLRARAFMPHKGEVSVFRIDGLDDAAVWRHIREYASRPDRNVHGRGDFRLADVEGRGLSLAFDDTPPRHGNVGGWPEDKDRQLAIARALARAAKAVEPPSRESAGPVAESL